MLLICLVNLSIYDVKTKAMHKIDDSTHTAPIYKEVLWYHESIMKGGMAAYKESIIKGEGCATHTVPI